MSYSTHPAFNTSFANREMFGWAERNEPTHALQDGRNRYSFTKLASGRFVRVVTRTNTKENPLTYVERLNRVMPIEMARQTYRNLRQRGAEVI